MNLSNTCIIFVQCYQSQKTTTIVPSSHSKKTALVWCRQVFYFHPRFTLLSVEPKDKAGGVQNVLQQKKLPFWLTRPSGDTGS
jgi:hypothetical protein